ncbi:MAG TPA: ATP-binding protein, partial [Blastocatellia bacterium]|nr:ATP-binding protein [Blastocatellia bacterium]
MKNPFQYGRELGVDELVDRETEVAEVVSTIQEGGKLFLIGPRRYGKTSILQAAQSQAEKAGAVVLRYDAEAWPTLDLLVRAVLIEATQRLSTNLDKAGDKLRKFFSRLKPEINFNLADQTLSGSLGVNADDAKEPGAQTMLLVDLLNGLEKLAAEAARPVGLMLDEFQKVIMLGGEEAEGQIR